MCSVFFPKIPVLPTCINGAYFLDSNHEVTESVFSGDKSFDEPAWGTFDNDDVDSVWGFNAVGSSKVTRFFTLAIKFILVHRNFVICYIYFTCLFVCSAGN